MNIRFIYSVHVVHGPLTMLWYFSLLSHCYKQLPNFCHTGSDNFDTSFSARNLSGEHGNSVATSKGLREIKTVLVRKNSSLVDSIGRSFTIRRGKTSKSSWFKEYLDMQRFLVLPYGLQFYQGEKYTKQGCPLKI